MRLAPGELPAVARRAVREAISDDLAGESAKVAYYFFLSFFPLLLSLFAFLGTFGNPELFDRLMEPIRAAAPGETAALLGRLLDEVSSEGAPGLLSVGILLTLWSASSIFAALADGLNAMWDLEEDRSWWRRRGVALVALLVVYLLLLPAAVAIVAGPELVGLARLDPVWSVLRWPAAFLALVGVMWLLYTLLPARSPAGHHGEMLAGALVGATMWVGITVAFRIYVLSFGRWGRSYGLLGGAIVLLLWLYLTALAILFGGEVAATLEQRSRTGARVGGEASPEGGADRDAGRSGRGRSRAEGGGPGPGNAGEAGA